MEGNKITAVLKIRDGINLPEGSYFSLGADGILGEKFVVITPPAKLTGRMLAAGTTVVGTQGSGLDEFIAKAGKTMEKVDSVVTALNNVFGDEAVQQSMREGFLNMRDIMVNLNDFSRTMAELASANQQNITLMVRELSEMSGRMNAAAAHVESLAQTADADGATGRNVAIMAENLAIASERVERITGKLEAMADNPQTTEDLQATLKNARAASEKANKALDVLGSARLRTDVSYNDKNSDWLTNMGVEFTPDERSSLYIGAHDLGGESKLDLQAGHKMDNVTVRAGAMQGKFGVGLDYRVSPSFRIFTDIYDFDDTKVKVGGEAFLTPDLSLIGQSYDVRGNGSDRAYFGIRAYF